MSHSRCCDYPLATFDPFAVSTADALGEQYDSITLLEPNPTSIATTAESTSAISRPVEQSPQYPRTSLSASLKRRNAPLIGVVDTILDCQ